MSRRADDVVARLRTDIVSGSYERGRRLTEAQLCAEYGVSRVPVREALKSLEAEGFLVSRPYAGVSVSGLDVTDAEDLYAVRRSIEQATVRRCAQRFRDCREHEDRTELESFRHEVCGLLDEGEAGLHGDRIGLAELNTRFHLLLASFSGSGPLEHLLRQVTAKIEWLYRLDVDTRGDHSWAEHREIAEAVLHGRVSAAVDLIGVHIDRSLRGYLARHVPPYDGRADG